MACTLLIDKAAAVPLFGDSRRWPCVQKYSADSLYNA